MPSKKKFRRTLFRHSPPLIYFLIRCLFRSIRWTEINYEAGRIRWNRGKQVIIAFWHGRMLMCPCFYRGRGIKIMISRHGDGELIHQVMERFGFQSVRGSTSKGAMEAFRTMTKLGKEGWDLTVTPDGPRGPRYVVQRGVIELAKQTGLPILPVTVGAEKRYTVGSWDAMQIPLPFTRGVVACGELMYVPKNASPDQREALRSALEQKLRDMTEAADRFYSL